MATRESNLRDQVAAFLKGKSQCWHVKNLGSAMGRRGIPDFVICFHGRFVAIELKAGKGVTTPIQDVEHAKIAAASGVVAVARSLDEVKRILEDVEMRVAAGD